ncbi:hypothetical protein SAMN04487886_10359 [Clostridium sp. DSM 8431]|uniref:hypothetical protein n=1 Tax=Clostridium sp. DSM 8431 TaxID=1761781 RepID=UPI0008E0D81D|nr:hypothetical protein [Clostridium sp. DSM 8431]SFU47071.1 hypothetical protein SAMN04487886_10359 [Clostridium sp. DSM 8431]
MGYEKVIQRHYEEINSLTSMLRNYIEMYRLLVSSTSELNTIAPAKKSEVKHALERLDALGDVIDDILKVIKKCEPSYIRYLCIKNEVINEKIEKNVIRTELNDELTFENKESPNEDNKNK